MDRRQQIESTLREALGAVFVEVIDESHLHAGHAGARSGGGHFRATIVSDRFEGISIVEAQRIVYAALKDEMGSLIHALSMKTIPLSKWRGADA